MRFMGTLGINSEYLGGGLRKLLSRILRADTASSAMLGLSGGRRAYHFERVRHFFRIVDRERGGRRAGNYGLLGNKVPIYA